MDENKSDTNSILKTTLIGVLGNFFLVVIKLSSGILGNSYALIADGIESIADIFSSIIVFLGLKYSQKPADKNHPYGHGRIEPIITFSVVTFLVVSASFIAFQSIENINTPHELPKPWTLIILAGIIIWKEVSYRIVKSKGIEVDSTALKAEAWHHRSDAITSLMAFLGISIATIFGNGYETADDWAALGATLFILYNSYKIFRPALSELMDEHIYDDLIEQIRTESKKIEGVIDTEKCFVRKLGNGHLVDLHIIVDGKISVKEGHDISHSVKDHLLNKLSKLQDVLIHIEPNN